MKVFRNAMLSVVAVLIILVPVPAQADVLTRYDTTGDVRKTLFRDDFEPPPPSTAVPTRTIGDILRMRIDHNDTAVRVVVKFKALVAAGYYHIHNFEIRTPSLIRLFRIYASPGDWKGSDREFTDQAGNAVACSGLKHLIEYKNATITLTISRACLKNPSSIRVGNLTQIVAGEGSFYYDHAQVNGGKVPYTDAGPARFALTLSPPVSR